jgi:uncharacterized SAM-binding protein YcdF (DUF218 family)
MVLAWLGQASRPLFRFLLRSLGVFALVLVVLAFTRIPFDAHRSLGTAARECEAPPQAIVLLGGSGMPSGAELLRLHHAAGVANAFPTAPVHVVHPLDTAVMRLMVDELVLRGVERARVHACLEGTNTREQALSLLARMPELRSERIALVTAPENMYRSVRAFRKAGATAVCGSPAWEHAMFIDLGYGHRRIGGKPWMPDVGQEAGLRYTFWNYLKLEITCLREYVAIGYYWLNDWI